MSKSKKKPRRKYRDANYSSIKEHKRIAKKLVPPLNRLPNFNSSSWSNDHAPEMLWAFLLAAILPRDEYLSLYRRIVEWFVKTFSVEESTDIHEETKQPPAIDRGLDCEIDHTSLAELSDGHFKEFVSILLSHALGYGTLRPLLLLDSLPGVDRWRAVLDVDPTVHDWETLGHAVIETLDHQSEKSTDVRWLKCVLKLLLGKLIYHESMQNRVTEIFRFPNVGDMRQVRPHIRSSEMTIRRQPPSAWIKQYWKELMTKTSCIDASNEGDYFKLAAPGLTRDAILEARSQVAERFRSVMDSTGTDARLDTAFGFTLYALSLLEEIAAPPYSQLLMGRLGLRSLAEVVIIFSYLLKKDDSDLWSAYRNYGSGQAKLAFLKIEEMSGDSPSFVSQDTLYGIANEDRWQEFVDVNFGHWAGMDARKLAIAGDTKNIYDRFYDWTSTFVHSQWCAVRDSNYMTCHNPLHRLHRIPRPYHRIMPTVVPDAIELVNKTFELLEAAFPSMQKFGRIEPISGGENGTNLTTA